MFWLFVVCLLALVTIPPLIALFESVGPAAGTRDVGFWALARAVAGSCHVPWGRKGVPIVRFSLPDGEARIRAIKGERLRTVQVEMRSYQAEPFRFAGRMTSPPLAPLRWRAPGLESVNVEEEDGLGLPDFAFESTDKHLLLWLLRRPRTRGLLEDFGARTGARQVEILLLNAVVVLTARTPSGWRMGAAVEHLGPPMVELLRQLSKDLADLATAMSRAGEENDLVPPCPVCSQAIEVDPMQCSGCGVYLHRGC